MSKLSRLQTRLTAVQARLAEIVAAYPTLAKYKSYSQGFGQISTTYQDFGAVGSEYRRLLELEAALEDQIAAINDAENSSSYVAEFREVQG